MGKGWADIHIGKGVFGRFGFDDRRISQIHRQVKNKATGTPQGMYYIQPSLSSDAKTFVGTRCSNGYTSKLQSQKIYRNLGKRIYSSY